MNMKRLINLSKTDLTVRIEGIGITTFNPYQAVFSLSKNAANSFQLSISPALPALFDITPSGSAIENALKIVSELTNAKNYDTEMHEFIKQFQNSSKIINGTFQFTNEGALINKPIQESKSEEVKARTP